MAPRRKGDKRGRREGEAEETHIAARAAVATGNTTKDVAPRIFVDLDGTLVDFASAVRNLGADVNGDRTVMWEAIAAAPKFWRSLPWLTDGKTLWKLLEPLHPVVLTGLPDQSTLRKRAEDQKKAWCREHLGSSVEVICVSAKDKYRFSGPGYILIDDDERHRGNWEKRGGYFVARANVSETWQAVEATITNGPVVPASASIADAELALALQRNHPTEEERSLRAQVVASARNGVNVACEGRLVAALVGSSGAGLASGSSDLDFAVVPASGQADASLEISLEALAKALESGGGMRDVEVIVTRSKAPNVIKCVQSASGIQCDFVSQSGTNGVLASIDKCALLRQFSFASAHFRPLALLVKEWAKGRHLVDPTGRKLNSFTFTLMAAFFLQINGFLPVPESTFDAVASRRAAFLERDEELQDPACTAESGIAALLQGFFDFWRKFEFHTSCASVRCGKCSSIDVTKLHPYETEQVFVVVDPIEPDENTARTLSHRNLEELRAELNRAYVLMQCGSSWDAVCHAPAAKKTKELKQFYLPPLAATSTMVSDVIGRSFIELHALELLDDAVALTDATRASMKLFIEQATVGSWMCVAHRLPTAERRLLQKLADACDIELQGRYDIELQKKAAWASGAADRPHMPRPWTAEDHEQLLKLVPSDSSSIALLPSPCVASVPIEAHVCLKTVKTLREGTSLETLQAKYKLIVKKHPRFDIVQLSYSQTESQMSTQVVQECRGLILEQGTWNVVSLPFTKFFNHGETNAKALDWAGGVRVHEKLDGSIMTLYWYRGAWNVASNKLPAGDGLVPDGGTKSFADVFWEVWTSKGYKLPSNRSACFMFELLSPSHTIVVRHQEANLVCLGGRNLQTLDEFSCEEAASRHGWDTPPLFGDLRDLDSVLAATRLLNPIAQEGFVAVDRHWNRLKIKSASYVALHHLSSNLCWRNSESWQPSSADEKTRHRSLIQIARYNEGDEFLAYFPELEQEFVSICARFRALRRYLEHCASSGLESVTIPDIERLSRKLRRGEGTAAKLLRDMKIQELEAAMDVLPADVIAELSKHDGVSKAANEGHSSNIMSGRDVADVVDCSDVRLQESSVDTSVQAKEDSDSDEDYAQKTTPRKAANRFAAFNNASSSDSEPDD